MIAAVRIRGQVGLERGAKETLFRLRLRRKYACVLVDEKNKTLIGMLKDSRNFISYGEISEDTKKQLMEKRAKKDKEGNIKPFFRLHPPRGGINSKFHYPKGVLGENKKMDELILRML